MGDLVGEVGCSQLGDQGFDRCKAWNVFLSCACWRRVRCGGLDIFKGPAGRANNGLDTRELVVHFEAENV